MVGGGVCHVRGYVGARKGGASPEEREPSCRSTNSDRPLGNGPAASSLSAVPAVQSHGAALRRDSITEGFSSLPLFYFLG